MLLQSKNLTFQEKWRNFENMDDKEIFETFNDLYNYVQQEGLTLQLYDVKMEDGMCHLIDCSGECDTDHKKRCIKYMLKVLSSREDRSSPTYPTNEQLVNSWYNATRDLTYNYLQNKENFDTSYDKAIETIRTDRRIFTSISESTSTSISESTSEDDTTIVEYASSIHIFKSPENVAIIKKQAEKPDGVPRRPFSDDEKLKNMMKEFVKSQIKYINDDSELFKKIKQICTNLNCKMENCPHVTTEVPCINIEPNVIRCTLDSNIVGDDLDTKHALNFIYGLPITYDEWIFKVNDEKTTCEAPLNQKYVMLLKLRKKLFEIGKGENLVSLLLFVVVLLSMICVHLTLQLNKKALPPQTTLPPWVGKIMLPIVLAYFPGMSEERAEMKFYRAESMLKELYRIQSYDLES